jgi:ribosome-associated heat shock protein Hsp15
MSEINNIRIDKFLWAVRIFKTRSLASEACRNGKIIINDILVKPSRTIAANETIFVKKLPITYCYTVVEPIGNRISAKLVHLYINDITPESEKTKIINRELAGFAYREKGAGRPTKKDRRNIDRLKKDFDTN